MFDSKGGKTRIENGVVELFTKYDELFLRGLKRGCLYEMELLISKELFYHTQNEVIDLAEPEVFCGISVESMHQRLGHVSIDKVKKIIKEACMSIDDQRPAECVDCALSKITRILSGAPQREARGR